MASNASFNFKRLLPHLLIVLGFAVLCLIYFYPALQGKKLFQGDNVSWQAMSHEAKEWHDTKGENTLWSNSMFGGMPTYLTYVPEGKNYVYYIQAAVTNVLSKPAYFLFIAMLSFYVLMLVLRVNKWLGVVGAVAFALSTYNLVIIAAGHDTKMLALAYIPAALAGFIIIYRGRYLTGAALMGAALALQLSNGHYQVTYYTGLIFGFAFLGMLANAVKDKNWKRFLISSVVAGAMGGLSIGVIMGGLLPSREYEKISMRGGGSELTKQHDKGKKGGLDKDYAFQWSNGRGETLCALIPDLYGGSSDEAITRFPDNEGVYEKYLGRQKQSADDVTKVPTYWGPQPFLSGPVYFGAIICFLFLLGMLIIRSSHKWWIFAVSALALLMSMGKSLPDFNYWLFDHLPLLNKFRTPTMVLIIPEVLFPILAIWAFQEAVNGKESAEREKQIWQRTLIAGGITAGICLIVALMPSTFFSFTTPAEKSYPEDLLTALKDDRISMARTSAFKSALYILAAAGLILAYIRKILNKNILIGALGLLILIDMVPVAHRYLNEDNFKDAAEYDSNFEKTELDKALLSDPDPYHRILDLTRNAFNDAKPAYYHKIVGGYHPAKMEIYQDLIEAHLDPQNPDPAVLSMLNTKYIISVNNERTRLIIDTNKFACGNAWFVSNYKLVPTADAEMDSLSAAPPVSFNPNATAFIRKTFEQNLQGFTPYKDSASKVTLAKYGLDEISFSSQNSKEGLAVFSDIWYPYGWKAFVDGKETPIIRANYVLRALRLPAGNHNIVFRFHPDAYYTGNTISLISSLLLFALIIFALYKAYTSKGEHSEVDKAWASKD